MTTAIRVDDGPVVAVGYPLDSSVQHGVHKIGVWTRTDGPADHQTIEAVNHGREVHLASRYLELGDVGQPFLIRGGCLEVTIDEVVWRWADFAKVGAIPTPSISRAL